jgi:hypothetical protein
MGHLRWWNLSAMAATAVTDVEAATPTAATAVIAVEVVTMGADVTVVTAAITDAEAAAAEAGGGAVAAAAAVVGACTPGVCPFADRPMSLRVRHLALGSGLRRATVRGLG